MSHKTPIVYLQDILESIEKIDQYIADIDYQKSLFENNIEKQDAVLRRLEIIGEATKKLESDFRTDFPQIPWRKMAGMRDVLIHDYDQVDLDLVWEVVSTKLPEIKHHISTILKRIAPNQT